MRSSLLAMRATADKRSHALACRSLPFEPMALITLDKLNAHVAASRKVSATSPRHLLTDRPRSHRSRAAPEHVTSLPAKAADTDVWSSQASALQWFQAGLPFFVSPKHDGVRLVTYAPPSTPHTHKSQVVSGSNATTCFSRHGRPIHGLSWIESELALLRTLAGDPALSLDGELYIHKSAGDGSARPRVDSTARRSARKDARVHPCTSSAALTRVDSEKEGGASVAQSGFLAVNALLTRLRGSSSRTATVADVLHYVDTLPTMCAFDVIAYHPCTVDSASSLPAHTPVWVRECHRVREAVMATHRLRDLECLQCTPNLTPFSQRLRTLFFLASLLEKAAQSTVLSRQFHLTPSHGRASWGGSAAGQSVLDTYRGGHHVKAVPYDLSHSLKEVERKVLANYTANGYEGVVVRAPNNLYEMREKRKGVVQMFTRPLEERARGALTRTTRDKGAATGPALKSSSASASSRSRRASPRQLLACHHLRLEDETAASSGSQSNCSQRREEAIYRTYTSTAKEGKLRPERSGQHSDNRAQEDAEALDTLAAVAKAVRRARGIPSRSFSVVKVLPFRDQEYPVLRPLLKPPSTNPHTRPLATMQTKDGAVAFYGLQCLADNGRVFNVTLPRMAMSDQRALLAHLTAVCKKRASRADPLSLTGLYVTVKYGALTAHGVPRFGVVKAVRGGKGWFL